jgi:hypothetical protein
MKIIIMRTEESPVCGSYTSAHAVWLGTMKEAQEWCKMRNDMTGWVKFEAVRVEELGKPKKCVDNVDAED